jgi:uncharacterized membrane protein
MIIVSAVRSMNTPSQTAIVYSAILRPHRSAGPGAARIVCALLAVVWTAAGMVFVIAGAWPVVPFLGIEVLLLAGALFWNLRAGEAQEVINLSEQALTVRRVDHWGKETQVSFPPKWLQVNIDDRPTMESRLELRSHGRSLIIGKFLLPHERLELARILRRELSRIGTLRALPDGPAG